MNAQRKAEFLRQLDAVDEAGRSIRRASEFNDWSDQPEGVLQAFVTRCLSVIHRVGGLGSVYAREADLITNRKEWEHTRAHRLLGVVQGLRSDVDADYLTTATEAIHADTFADFLERAQHLQDEGHKDAAAVVAGSTLEAHLRNLCVKFSVPLEVSTAKGLAPKRADVMNADLYKANAYNGIVQKSVTHWLAIRNDAAHGHYDKYSAEQVKLLILSVRDFISSNPA